MKKSLVYLDDSIYLNYLCMYLFVIMYRTPHPLYVKTSKNVKKVVAQEGTNTLIFYVFEYDAEYGTEYSAESGAKQYFV